MRHLRQVARVLGQERQLFFLLVRFPFFENGDRFFANAVHVEAFRREDARSR